MPASALLLCLVLSVHDGDTIRVHCEDDAAPVTRSIRVAYIDAPELAQPWGKASRNALAKMCLGKRATVAPITQDRYGRTVATVSCKGVDVSTRQVERGMAWVYTKYAPTDTPLVPIQHRAQIANRGLWHDEATAPSEWRAAR